MGRRFESCRARHLSHISILAVGYFGVETVLHSVMVDVAQLVEPRIVIPVVAGSIPVVHPITPLYFLSIFSIIVFI